MTDAAAALPIQREATPAFRLVRFLAIPLLRALFQFQVSGREHIPADGPYLLVANHLNWLDNFAILLAFPAEPRVHFLADPELLRRRRVQWWIVRKTAGYIAVDVHKHPDPEMRDRVLFCLGLGGVVAIYPEGSYGPREGHLQPFKKGFAHFALGAGAVPVVPVALSGTREPWVRKRVEVIIGPPIEAGDADVDSLVRLTQERLGGLLPVYREGPGAKPMRHFLKHLF